MSPAGELTSGTSLHAPPPDCSRTGAESTWEGQVSPPAFLSQTALEGQRAQVLSWGQQRSKSSYSFTLAPLPPPRCCHTWHWILRRGEVVRALDCRWLEGWGSPSSFGSSLALSPSGGGDEAQQLLLPVPGVPQAQQREAGLQAQGGHSRAAQRSSRPQVSSSSQKPPLPALALVGRCAAEHRSGRARL